MSSITENTTGATLRRSTDKKPGQDSTKLRKKSVSIKTSVKTKALRKTVVSVIVENLGLLVILLLLAHLVRQIAQLEKKMVVPVDRMLESQVSGLQSAVGKQMDDESLEGLLNGNEMGLDELPGRGDGLDEIRAFAKGVVEKEIEKLATKAAWKTAEIRPCKLMEELQKLLNRWKTNGDKKTAYVDQGEVENERVQQETIIESQSGERLTQIKSYYSDLTKWSEELNKRSCHIISMLQKIESLLIELPVSHRAKMQPMYSCLYAEADTFMDNMMDRVRIHCDKKPRCSNVLCYELATQSQPFS
ncbi:hypothetical protein Tco_1443305 [Tanacetum coccineum]